MGAGVGSVQDAAGLRSAPCLCSSERFLELHVEHFEFRDQSPHLLRRSRGPNLFTHEEFCPSMQAKGSLGRLVEVQANLNDQCAVDRQESLSETQLRCDQELLLGTGVLTQLTEAVAVEEMDARCFGIDGE